jgi:hypothetical protein
VSEGTAGWLIPETGPTAEERERLARLGAPPGLCASCRHLRVLASRRSVFVRCGRAETDAAFPRYPGLPVIRCRGYEAAEVETP